MWFSLTLSPEGSLVLLQDHPKGHNKIQDYFKEQEFVVVEQLCEPNVYQIKPLSDVGLDDNNSDEEMGNIPSYNPKTKWKELPHTHKYATQAKGQPTTLVQSTIVSMRMDQSDGLSS